MDLGIKLLPQHNNTKSDPVDVSVVIAHRGPVLGLWATLESCKMDLDSSGLSYELIVVANGTGERLEEDLALQKHWLSQSGRLGGFIHTIEPMSPPTARQLGSEHARGDYLFFFDNHCLVKPGYFVHAVDSMRRHNIDVLHSTTRFWMGEQSWYEYSMSLELNFWVKRNYDTPLRDWAYPIACGGHGGFAVRADFWRRVDGYWQGFEGYAGEEPYFDFKAWLMGGSVYIDPEVVHHHWSGKRSYNRHYTDDYFRNLLMAAHIIGGEKWLYTVYDSFVGSTRLIPRDGKPLTPMFDILESAYKRSLSRRQWLEQRQVRSFDEQLAYFAHNGIRI